jgi:hypothetical protein
MAAIEMFNVKGILPGKREGKGDGDYYAAQLVKDNHGDNCKMNTLIPIYIKKTKLKPHVT